MAHNGNSKREALALRLAAGQSVRAAARSCKVGERTAHRWLDEDPRFRARVQELRERLFSRAVGVLTRLAGKAARKLDELLDNFKASIALGACRTVLEAGPRLRELIDFEERLAALEAAQQAQQAEQGQNRAGRHGGFR
jgi:hypothetical protein